MIINKGLIIQECSHTLPHEAHSWWEWQGIFRWYAKQTCQGMTPEQFDVWMERKCPSPYNKNHKHRMFLSRWWSTTTHMVFVCDFISAGCKRKHTISREEYRHHTIRGYTTWPLS